MYLWRSIHICKIVLLLIFLYIFSSFFPFDLLQQSPHFLQMHKMIAIKKTSPTTHPKNIARFNSLQIICIIMYDRTSPLKLQLNIFYKFLYQSESNIEHTLLSSSVVEIENAKTFFIDAFRTWERTAWKFCWKFNQNCNALKLENKCKKKYY